MKKTSLKIVLHLIVVLVLTTLTQVGGLVYLVVLLIQRYAEMSVVKSCVIFFALYLASSFVALPLLAPIFGRVALPLNGGLRPLNFATCILNRHYVEPELKRQLVKTSGQLSKEFGDVKINYLDACFPFFDGFPLFPHLSHSDGKKVDLAFIYLKNGAPSDGAPSFMGYGVYEEPKKNESDFPAICKRRGYWQYSLLSAVVLQWEKKGYSIDVKRTHRLIKLLAGHQGTSKIFLEPHLKERWDLGSCERIRFHGCQAVRHDDHIHLEIR